jgi:hydrogenase maturation protease
VSVATPWAGALVVGLGAHSAGDDGVGLEVAAELARRGVSARASSDASVIFAPLERGLRVVIVDAVVGRGAVGGDAAGTVVRLAADADAFERGGASLSSHGLGLADAIELVRVLYGDGVARSIEIVGVVIDPPRAPSDELSAVVRDAIGSAADFVEALLVELERDAQRAAQ